MHVPDHFRQTDREAALRLIETHPFGLLAAGTEAAHIPFVLDRERGVLQCHVAAANPLWRRAEGAEVLAVFTGPHAYVSPDWYANRTQVPTWNFLAVHVIGRAARLSEAALEAHLSALAGQSEAALAPKAPWTLDAVAPDRLAAMRRGIVGLEIRLARIDAKWKLSQNRGSADRRGVAKALAARGGENDMAIAGLMASREEEQAHDQ